MKKIDLRIIFAILLLVDLCFSFIQHYHKSLDGDIASIVLGYPEVMSDPLGLNVLLEQKVYGGTNRFFAHWMMSVYFKQLPLLFQNFANPVESIYLACAFAKTIIQLMIMLALSSMISGVKNIWNKNFLLAAILVTPLFQTNGYNGYMGIINSSITYTFFYALPLALLLLFFLPFHNRIVNESWRQLNYLKCLILVILSLILALGGPLSPAIIIIGSTLILFNYWKKHFKKNPTLPFFQKSLYAISGIPKILLFFLSFISLLSIYSIYIGQYNAENFFHTVTLSERYKLLPTGLYYSFSQKLGLPILLLMTLLNLFLISKQERTENTKQLFVRGKWIALFIAIYILILPFGGYREYRPNIVRADTLLPVIICIIYMFGISTRYLLSREPSKLKHIYSGVVILFLMVFVVADKSVTSENDCEKDALNKIALSTEEIVYIDNQCTVMSWNKISDYRNSKLNCELFKRWGVIKIEKAYYQK